ncbi:MULTISPECIES: serine/threonine-protein kinase [unclassified Streptomyces]|uniref:serine/threonine-protein kinase n=1 Tax=unclassified Streptomyces TaxID=2593676 RepID=UPI0004BED30E|nr:MULTISPECIES: serine/threonine-protein kinase [unclassified Streptomyces]
MGTEGENVRVIAGRYRLRDRLGRGGMGVVWRATDELLARDVAVKELPFDDSLSATEARARRDRTLREARAVAQLGHPHIVVVHDVVEDDERPYIVMELIDGGSLADRLAADGPLDVREVARIGVDLLGALRRAHEAGVLHRDLKPANVLLERGTGRVVLTDFGIAQVAGATTLTETGSFVGSPEYTAPERMTGAGTGPESDLWSLGALLCAALSGESPFRRDSLGEVLHAVVLDDIRPPERAGPLLPVVRGLLDRDPERRMGATEAERLLREVHETGRAPRGTATGRTPGRLARGTAGRTPLGSYLARTPSYTPTQRDVPQAPAATPPVTPRPPGRYSTRALLLAAALVAALTGAGVTAAALLVHGDGGGGGEPGRTGPGASVTATGPTTTVASPGASTRASTSASTPASGPTASTTASTAAGHTAPSGYRTVRDPDGFSLAVPDGFTRRSQGERVFYMSAGGHVRIGIKVTDPDPRGPLAVMRRAHAGGPSSNPGYHDGSVTRTGHGGHPAALWEFTWEGFDTAAEGPRHTYDLCWDEGGRMYDVWVSAPVGKVREAREYFDVAVDTFTAASVTGG